MPGKDIIVIGGSAGALEPLLTILQGLPGQLNATVFVVQHTSPESGGALPQILERSGNLPAHLAIDGEPIRPSEVYVAPPDHHLILGAGTTSVDRGPRENGFRPAIDPLFRSAAMFYPHRSIGVILSGALDDGTFGLMSLKEAGGLAIVQHPYEALVPSMPLSAIQNVEVDHIVRASEMAGLIIEATILDDVPASTRDDGEPEQVPSQTDRDVSLNGVPPDLLEGPPSYFSCPECGGTLWELTQGNMFRFRCHTGHGFTPETLLTEQAGKFENALWMAVRVLQERSALHRQIADKVSQRGMTSAAWKYEERAQEEEAKAAMIRTLLRRRPAEEGSPGTTTGVIGGENRHHTNPPDPSVK